MTAVCRGAKLSMKIWNKVSEDLLWLQTSDYNFKETCADLEYEFLSLERKQALAFFAGKFLGAIKPKFTEYLASSHAQKSRGES